MRLGEHTVALLVVFIVSMLAIAGNADFEEEMNEQERYCKMTALYEATDGDVGWPDYRKAREKLCDGENKRLSPAL